MLFPSAILLTCIVLCVCSGVVSRVEVSGVVSLRYIFRVRGVCDRAEFLNEPPGAEAYQLFLTRACIYNSQRLPSLPPGVNFSFHKVYVVNGCSTDNLRHYSMKDGISRQCKRPQRLSNHSNRTTEAIFTI